MNAPFFRRPPPLADERPLMTGPDWKQANPVWIARALDRALALPSGGWYVVGGSTEITDRPRRHRVLGRDLVAWRTPAGVHLAPDACPHMGASLSDGCVRDGNLVCPWHGLELSDRPHGKWRPLPVHDDGVLTWVRLSGEDQDVSAAPFLPVRPQRFVDAVMRVDADCEPQDVIANRLDPWHGVHFHPHSFSRLQVIDRADDEVTVRVSFRIVRGLDVEVDARFHCSDPRTIAMTIVAGEGAGSVVETHATPIGPGRTAIIEATLATSDRRGFGVAVATGRLLRPLIRRRALRLWQDDAAYAERRYRVRTTD